MVTGEDRSEAVRNSLARLPPRLDGLDPRWSRLVPLVDADGVPRTFHVLDSAGAAPSDAQWRGTLLCVHGNPTWSYLWRRLVAAPPPGWRVLAVDQLGMGYSARPAGMRRLAQRIDDLGRLTDALNISGSVITVAHDWGGVISLGWAAAHRDQLAGIVLTNTAVHQPAGSEAPTLIKVARTAGLRQLICQWTPGFVVTAAGLSRPALPRATRRGLAAPYRMPRRRRAIADFVADIPLNAGHPSAAALTDVETALPALVDVPTLLLWGPRDPVFSRRYLDDVHARLPGADVHLFAGASHLVTEDRPEYVQVIADWVRVLPEHRRNSTVASASAEPPRALDAALMARATADGAGVAVVEPGKPAVDFAELEQRVAALADGLRRIGVQRGDRIAMLVPPGVDLTVAVYASWRIGAVIVVADAGLGLRRLGAALRSAGGHYVIGSAKGLAAARALRVPGMRILVGAAPTPLQGLSGLASHTVAELSSPAVAGSAQSGPALSSPSTAPRPPLTAAPTPSTAPPPPSTASPSPPPPFVPLTAAPSATDECAVVFTSGATGPPKGVVYRVGQLRAQIDLIAATYQLTSNDRLVAAFAPFALYGPAFGIASAVPDMDVTAPATLTAAALADAIAAVDATVVFASPAALRNVVATAGAVQPAQHETLSRPRLVMSAGAPLTLPLLRSVADLFSGAQIHTPYGMTEALPVTDVNLNELEEAGDGVGVCVGRPVAGVDVGISALDDTGAAPSAPQTLVDVTGEVCVRAAHVKDRYDRLWSTEAKSSRDVGWHRTGDVGHLDAQGRLWIEGRLVDVVTTEQGPITPVPVENRLLGVEGISAAAVIGVGPAGAQQAVAVVVSVGAPASAGRRRGRLRLALARTELAASMRAAAGVELAAVLTMTALPVDIRHNSKIDHPALRRAADRFLAGRR